MAEFRAAAEARSAAAVGGTHFSFSREGTQRSSAILGALGGISSHMCSHSDVVVSFAVDEGSLNAARRHVTLVEHGMTADAAEDLGTATAAASAGVHVATATPLPEYHDPPVYGRVVLGGSQSPLSEEDQLAMALALSLQDQAPVGQSAGHCGGGRI